MSKIKYNLKHSKGGTFRDEYLGTGDGTNTIFSLTNTPAEQSDVLLTVDGLKRKLTTDFSISGKNITFLFAPSNGSEIEAFYSY